jgi:hypothetical protein
MYSDPRVRNRFGLIFAFFLSSLPSSVKRSVTRSATTRTTGSFPRIGIDNPRFTGVPFITRSVNERSFVSMSRRCRAVV